MMKKCIGKFINLLAAVFILCPVFIGCTPPAPLKEAEYCVVVISDGAGFRCSENIRRIKRGENAVFNISVKNGYAVSSLDYKDYEIGEESAPDSQGNRAVKLTLKNVRYSVNVEIRTSEAERYRYVTVKENPAFICENPTVTVNEKGEARFKLRFLADYTFIGTDYEGDFRCKGNDIQNGSRDVTLILKNVSDVASVEIKAGKVGSPLLTRPDAAVTVYDANGANLIGGGGGTVTECSASVFQKRRNTLLGTDLFEREGYVFIGWNTRKDGSGKHIGSGSRFDAVKGAAVRLYANWSKQTDEKYFEYKLVDTADIVDPVGEKEESQRLETMFLRRGSEDVSAVVTKYTGKHSAVTVPETLGGKPVAAIAADAFYNDPDLSSLVLPKSVRILEPQAINYCQNLREVFLYDNITDFDALSFGFNSSVGTLHINAVLPPVYGVTENGQFANKMEMLAGHDGEKPKMVLFGGCALWYGVNSPQLNSAFSDEYDVFNMGVIGGTCATFQLDLIDRYMHKGDILLHLPELTSRYQLLADKDFDSRVFATLESNYDLLAMLNLNDYTRVWQALGEYFSGKRTILNSEGYIEKSYDDTLDYINAYGDIVKQREGNFDNEGNAYVFESASEMRDRMAAETMRDYYGAFAQKGIKVYLAYSPVNGDGLAGKERYELENYILDGFIRLNISAKTIMAVDDCIMDKKYFFDTNYHLSTEGTVVFTALLAERLKAVIL